MAKGFKTGGRGKGTPNRITSTIREKYSQLLEDYCIHQMKDDLAELRPDERLKIMVSLSEFIIPKMQRQSIEVEAAEIPAPVIKLNIK